MPSYTKSLHPQSLMMEMIWVTRWFLRLLEQKEALKTKGDEHTIFIADRSPFSAVFYSRNGRGKMLQPVIRAAIEELHEEAQIEVHTVYVQVQPDVLWKRIQERLVREPSRQKFSENDRGWMEKTLGFYDSFQWDCVVDNSSKDATAVMDDLVAIVSRLSTRFRRIVSGSEDEGDAKFSERVRAASIHCSESDASLAAKLKRTPIKLPRNPEVPNDWTPKSVTDDIQSFESRPKLILPPAKKHKGKMIVVCLEGCHGSGKTSLLSQLRHHGFSVLDEAFIDMPTYTEALHPQSLMMEAVWVTNWFERLLKCKAQIEGKDNEHRIYFADRSPYSAVFYSRKQRGHLLSPVIAAGIEELREEANIEVLTVHVTVQPDVLWHRIQQRLLREPHRHKFSENKIEWMHKSLNFYNNFQWDGLVDNSQGSIDDATHSVVSLVSRLSRRFQELVSDDQQSGRYSPEVRSTASLALFGDSDSDDLEEPATPNRKSSADAALNPIAASKWDSNKVHITPDSAAVESNFQNKCTFGTSSTLGSKSMDQGQDSD